MEVPGPSGLPRRRSRMYINSADARGASMDIETKPPSGISDIKDFVVDVTELSGTDTDTESIDSKAKHSELKQSERKREKVRTLLQSTKGRRVFAGIMMASSLSTLLAVTLYLVLTKATPTSLPAYPLVCFPRPRSACRY